jgi:hypothetical protein
MKLDWKKDDKQFYLPKTIPIEIKIPALKFFSIEGSGNPNDDFFAEYIGVLYSLSYVIKMSPKASFAPKDYVEYTVYPLEGIWDLKEEAKTKTMTHLDKNDLVFNLMIRQPDFVTKDYANDIIERTKKKKPNKLLDEVTFGIIEDGRCLQMMHLGSYDNEPASFQIMQDFCDNNGLIRESKQHREIYLSDVRRVAPEKLKTVLRFKVGDK